MGEIMCDSELILMYQNGDNNAFSILLNRHKSKIFNKIYFLTKDADLSNDLFQEVFIKIIQKLRAKKYDEKGKFLPWATRIAHNLVIDYFRKENKMKKVRETIVYDGKPVNIFSTLDMKEDTIENELILEQTNLELLSHLPLLPKEQQEIIRLRLYNEMSFKAIAEEKEISINTALGRMRYAIINLKKSLENNHSTILQH